MFEERLEGLLEYLDRLMKLKEHNLCSCEEIEEVKKEIRLELSIEDDSEEDKKDIFDTFNNWEERIQKLEKQNKPCTFINL